MSIWGSWTLKGYIKDCQKPSLWILWLTSFTHLKVLHYISFYINISAILKLLNYRLFKAVKILMISFIDQFSECIWAFKMIKLTCKLLHILWHFYLPADWPFILHLSTCHVYRMYTAPHFEHEISYCTQQLSQLLVQSKWVKRQFRNCIIVISDAILLEWIQNW